MLGSIHPDCVLFTPQPEQGENVAFGVRVQGKRGKIRSYGPPLYRLVAFVFFESEEGQAQFVPWAAPLKNRYNRNNQFHEQLIQLLYAVLYPYSLICETLTPEASRFFTQRWSEMPPEEKRASISGYFTEFDDELVDSIVADHVVDVDVDYVREYEFGAIEESVIAPFGYNVAMRVKRFLQKLNDERFGIDSTDFFIGFFARSANQLAAEEHMALTTANRPERLKALLQDPPDPDHLNVPYIEQREQAAGPEFETANLRIDPEEKESLIKRLSLPETASVSEVVDALKSHLFNDEGERETS